MPGYVLLTPSGKWACGRRRQEALQKARNATRQRNRWWMGGQRGLPALAWRRFPDAASGMCSLHRLGGGLMRAAFPPWAGTPRIIPGGARALRPGPAGGPSPERGTPSAAAQGPRPPSVPSSRRTPRSGHSGPLPPPGCLGSFLNRIYTRPRWLVPSYGWASPAGVPCGRVRDTRAYRARGWAKYPQSRYLKVLKGSALLPSQLRLCVDLSLLQFPDPSTI